MKNKVYLSNIKYVLGELINIATLRELENNSDTKEFLIQFGLKYYSRFNVSFEEAVYLCAKNTLETSNLASSEIDAVIFCSSSYDPYHHDSLISHTAFKCGINNCIPYGIFYGQCTNYSLALVVARAMISAGDCKNILVISGDMLWEKVHSSRITPFRTSIFSDGVVSLIVSDSPIGDGYELLDVHNVFLPETYEIMKSNNIVQYINNYSKGFLTSCEKLRSTVGLQITDYKTIVSGNFNFTVLRNLSALLECGVERLYTRNVARFAHCFSADQIIAIGEMCEEKVLSKGDQVLLVGSGGSLWSATALAKC